MRTFSDALDFRVTDSSLRDGSHAKRHQFTSTDVRNVVAALDAAGVPVIEVSHGDGLGGSSFTYGISRVDERVLIDAVDVRRQATHRCADAAGVGVKDDMRAAKDLGVSVTRIATHCTEADIAEQHFRLAREVGLETAGFLMMAHSQPPEVLPTQARLMADSGCQCVYVVDSAGALVPGAGDRPGRRPTRGARRRRAGRLPRAREPGVGCRQLGSRPSRRRGADRRLDPQVRGRRRQHTCRGARRRLSKLGIRTGIDPLAIIDAAEDVVRPVMDGSAPSIASRSRWATPASTRASCGTRSVPASATGSPVRRSCCVAGERRLVGGQEDQLIDIALAMAAQPATGDRLLRRPRRRRDATGGECAVTDIDAVARSLLRAADTATPIRQLIHAHPTMTTQEAYRVQYRQLELRLDRGEKLVGAKVGLTSRAKQRQVGVHTPVFGWLTDAELLAPAQALDLHGLIHPRAEPEIAFRLAHDLGGPGATVHEVLAATGQILGGIEIIDSRYRDFRFALSDVIADNTSAARVALTSGGVPPALTDLGTLGCVLEVDGEVVDSAAGAALLDHPAVCVAELANHLAVHGRYLPAGSIVLAGGLTEAVPLLGHRLLTARFADLGDVTVTLRSDQV